MRISTVSGVIPLRWLLPGSLLLLGLFAVEHIRTTPGEDGPDSCLACHSAVESPDPSHPVAVLGCSVCHLGNAYALEKDRAHAGMVTNPGDLRVAKQTCGQSGDCHAPIVPRVKASIMATNKGIVNTLYQHWESNGTRAAAPRGVAGLLADTKRQSLAEDHFAKMCATCHLWRERRNTGREMDRRGGGCSACHVVQAQEAADKELRSFAHAKLSTRIPSSNCRRCHNRSARQGLSYAGHFESAGYGTPYARGRPGTRRLSGGRFYLELPPDVHQQAWMACIDCHTHLEIMGDGQEHEYLRGQVGITCEMCHAPAFEAVRPDEKVPAERLVQLNRVVPELSHRQRAYAPKGSPLYHLRQLGPKTVLFRKLDGRPLFIASDSLDRPEHRLPGHERLSCQACHSRFMPQCYGCHLEYRQDESQQDKLSGAITRGRWREGRSYLRFEDPVLGVDRERISPFAPCQVLVSVFDAQGKYRSDKGFTILSMTSFDPHTTQADSRSCLDCHADPKAMGLGEGLLFREQGTWRLRPTYDPRRSGFGTDIPPEAFTTMQGRQLQISSDPAQRPFAAPEIREILRVTSCLGCHDAYDDPVYADFAQSRERLANGRADQCAVNTMF